MTLTFDLVFRIIMFRAYLLYYLRKESQIGCVDAKCRLPLFNHCDLELDL